MQVKDVLRSIIIVAASLISLTHSAKDSFLQIASLTLWGVIPKLDGMVVPKFK